MILRPPRSTLFPYTTALPICHSRGFPKLIAAILICGLFAVAALWFEFSANYTLTRDIYFTVAMAHELADRKSTRLNSSHGSISYAVFCLKKKNESQRLRKTLT